MHSRLVSHLRHNLVAYLALFVALGGTSYAAIKLPAKSVGTKQLKNRAVTPKKVAPSTIARFRGQTGPQGPQGLQGPQGEQGIQGVPGAPGSARAYGRVQATNVGMPATVTRSKGVVVVSNPQIGLFCIALDQSIDLSQTGMVVSPDLTGGATSFNGGNQPLTVAEWRSDPSVCSAGTYEVQTGSRSFAAGAINNTPQAHPFFFLVP
jgi:hypothetical protein